MNFFKNRGIGKKTIIISILVGLVLFGSGFFSGRALAGEKLSYLTVTNANTGIASQEFDARLYSDVWTALKQYYVDKDNLTEKELFYGSLKGMVAAAGDPYTVFMDPTETKGFVDDLSGTFEGIGAEVGLRDETITIIAPLNEMPAAKAGIKAGDKIMKIDGVTTADMTVDEAVKKIRGEKGTTVKLGIYRTGFTEVKDFIITRELISIKSVKTEMRKDGIYVITVSAFNDDTEKLFNAAVSDILLKNPKGIILDLRNNPGGYLDTAVMMGSEWVEKGPIVIEKYNNQDLQNHMTNGKARLKNIKTVVLVNHGSASASEIVAGALKDHEKATIIGDKTYGKGSVQNFMTLQDGSALKVTVAKWLTPIGESINDQGIIPNIEVKTNYDELAKGKDAQFDKALEVLKKK